MKAMVYRCYGRPQELKLEEVARPSVGAGDVLVRVHAAAVNAYDVHFLHGSPYLIRMSAGIGTPHDSRLGMDFAGTVEAVGKNVKRFKVGDAVFGLSRGAFAQYVAVAEDDSIALKPAAASFEEAAAVPMAGVTALQGLRDEGQLHAGEKVLINGASGGVGTFAVQIAKSLGAEVTAVCSTAHVQLVRSLGADHVIDYAREDFAQGTARYGLIIDAVGNRSFGAYQRVLEPHGKVVLIGAPPGDWVGPFAAMIHARLAGPATRRTFTFLMADISHENLVTLAELMQAGRIKAAIDRRYPLAHLPEAMQYMEAGHAGGKVIIDVEEGAAGESALGP
jgi:NADPH:quinone reductase-like Zn-dependent oxidoreductase